MLKKFFMEEDAQGMVEYGLIIALVAVVLIGGLTALNGGLQETLNSITNKLDR